MQKKSSRKDMKREFVSGKNLAVLRTTIQGNWGNPA